MHNHFAATLERLERVLRERIVPHVHTPIAPVAVEAWTIPDIGEPVSIGHALGLGHDEGRPEPDYRPVAAGHRWGPAWATTWFRIHGRIPEDAEGIVELVVDLGWFPHSVGGHCEALVLDAQGHSIKGLHPRNGWVRLRGPGAAAGVVDDEGRFEVYVEAAANPLLLGLPPFVETAQGEKGGEGALGDYELRRVDLNRFESDVWELAADLEVAGGLAAATPEDDPRRWHLFLAVERALDAYDSARAAQTAPVARAVLAPQLALPARASAHTVTAVGHAHIDSAWLWPLRETRRKLGRTVANALAVLDADPDAVYTMTSGQHFTWLEQDYPDLFARVLDRAAEGRFVPVGGMWVETDGVIPTGESLVRQMVLGKRYVRERFGREAREIWLPDSFGYSGALPQLARRAGFQWFLTQKISWNDTTSFPHHSFWWEGIDGTRVFTHFPPSDTYAAEVTAAELSHSVSNFRDKAIASHSLLAYGYGDGGGGPTREMLARAVRFADLDGSPRVRLRAPEQFFADAEAELSALTEADPRMAPTWCGELYLELHRGTLTTQVAMKQGNRRCEGLLRTAEHLATAAALTGAPYPAEELGDIWREVLLLQFHDILPGTSIAWVHREARDAYAGLETRLRDLIAVSSRQLHAAGVATAGRGRLVAGTSRRDGVVLPAADALAHAASAAEHAVAERTEDGGVLLVDDRLRLRTDRHGRIVSLLDLGEDRELAIAGQPLGELQLFRDEPVRWDAWDVDRHALRHPMPIGAAGEPSLLPQGEGPGYEVTYEVGASSIRLLTRLREGRVDVECHADWHEDEKLLKVALPLAVRAPSVRCETQYGFVERPVHPRTAGDDAMFEAAMHRYVHVGETGYGVGVVNDAMYGMDARSIPGGTSLRLSLLRAPRFPDPGADRGDHVFAWSLAPGADLPATVELAAELTAPIVDDLPGIEPLIRLEQISGHAVIDWIKLADDASGDVVARIYEPAGGHARTRLRPGRLLGADPTVRETDLLEEPVSDDTGDGTVCDGTLPWALGTVPHQTTHPCDGAELRLAPFQVVTVRVSPGAPGPGRAISTTDEEDVR